MKTYLNACLTTDLHSIQKAFNKLKEFYCGNVKRTLTFSEKIFKKLIANFMLNIIHLSTIPSNLFL